jgi:hypothetical protein
MTVAYVIPCLRTILQDDLRKVSQMGVPVVLLKIRSSLRRQFAIVSWKTTQGEWKSFAALAQILGLVCDVMESNSDTLFCGAIGLRQKLLAVVSVRRSGADL